MHCRTQSGELGLKLAGGVLGVAGSRRHYFGEAVVVKFGPKGLRKSKLRYTICRLAPEKEYEDNQLH